VRELAETENGKAAVTEPCDWAGKSFEKEVRLRENEVFWLRWNGSKKRRGRGKGDGEGKEGARYVWETLDEIEMLITVI